MQFTPQQLVGAGRYAPCTRIGNWNEDLMLEEARMQDFQLRKKQGSLLASHKMKHDFLHQPAPRSFDAQQLVHLNDAVSMQHFESDGLLACNVFEETPTIGSGEFLVTVSTALKASAPVARTTFRLVSPSAYKDALASGQALDLSCKGASLRYGDAFFIACNEALLVDDKSVLLKPSLLLKSGLKTETSMSPITYNPRVWLSPEPESAALWVCVRADLAKTEKLLSKGEPVRAGDPIAIVHKMTGQPLYTESKNKQPTDYGLELELCAYGLKNAGKYHNIGAEVTGTRTADTEGRANLPPNVWQFLLAGSPQEAVDNRRLQEPASTAAVVNVIQRCFMAPSLYSFRLMLVTLMLSDTRGTNHLSREEVKWLLLKQEHQLPLREEHLDLAFNSFDQRNTGHFPMTEFLSALRFPVTEARKARIVTAYDRLVHKKTDGRLTLNELCQLYDPSIDARVGAQMLTPEKAVAEYRELWLVQSGDSEISPQQFLEVYADISMVIGSEQHFEQVLEESWH